MSFRVEPDELDRFAVTSDHRGTELGHIADGLLSAEVPDGAFGRIPVISSRVHDAYREHIQRCLDGVRSAEAGMRGIATAVRAVADNYRATDGGTADDLTEFHRQFDDVSVSFAGNRDGGS